MDGVTFIKGNLERQLPQPVFVQIETALEGKSFGTQLHYLRRAQTRLSVYREILRQADRITLAGDGLIDVQANGKGCDTVPADWKVMTYVALTNGWRLVGTSTLERIKPKEGDAGPKMSRIDLTLIHEGGYGRSYHAVGKSELAEYRVDGQPAVPPSMDLEELYRWLQANGYEFSTVLDLGRSGLGLRKRKQTYVKELE